MFGRSGGGGRRIARSAGSCGNLSAGRCLRLVRGGGGSVGGRGDLVEEAAHLTSEVSVEFVTLGILRLAPSLLGSVSPPVVIDSNTDRARSQAVQEEQRASTADGPFIRLEPYPSGVEPTAVEDDNKGVDDSDWDKWEGFLNQLISGTEREAKTLYPWQTHFAQPQLNPFPFAVYFLDNYPPRSFA
ncbi:hypothetical protein DFJ73DRAFT_807493 [Zopfochytrium polystomum]|nr:hypothetical protein DFJ73DRAFT_807493 [Zopfochytrium polystomum]